MDVQDHHDTSQPLATRDNDDRDSPTTSRLTNNSNNTTANSTGPNIANTNSCNRHTGTPTTYKSGGLKFRSSRKNYTSMPTLPPTLEKYNEPMLDLRAVPLTYELAFYVSVEACQDVKDNWDLLVKCYLNSCKTDQVR